jgi:integrase
MTLEPVEMSGEAYDNFVNSLKSPATKTAYEKALRHYMKFLKISSFAELLGGEIKLVQARIISYVMEHRNNALSTSIIEQRLSAIKGFYSTNDVVLNWDKIYSYMGQRTKKRKNRPYSKEEITKLLSISMPRDRLIILLLASTGMRVGALCDIKLKHMKRINKYEIYQISVYDSEYEEYVAFCTPECAKAIDHWLNYRRSAGENVTPESYLFRDYFDINDALRVNSPKQLKTNTIEFQIHQKLIHAGLREGHVLENERKGSKRHEVRMAHGFRKFFDTTATQSGVAPLYVEMLRGKKLGLKGSYFIPTENDLLEGNETMKGYIAAINDLTINEENRLSMKMHELETEKDLLIKTLEKQNAEYNQRLDRLEKAFQHNYEEDPDKYDFQNQDLLNAFRPQSEEYLKAVKDAEDHFDRLHLEVRKTSIHP